MISPCIDLPQDCIFCKANLGHGFQPAPQNFGQFLPFGTPFILSWGAHIACSTVLVLLGYKNASTYFQWEVEVCVIVLGELTLRMTTLLLTEQKPLNPPPKTT